MQIPIIKAGDPVPEGAAIVLGRSGVYLKKSTSLFDGTVRIEGVPQLREVEEEVKWKAPKIPYRLVMEALEFFRAVYAKHKAEAIVLLSLQDGRWELLVPEQEVSGAHLDYRMDAEMARKRPVGTIHSHCDMSGFFSETDRKDVCNFDGVHLVLGRISLPVPEVAASVAMNGKTVELEPEEVVGGLPASHPFREGHPWLSKVRKREFDAGKMDGWGDRRPAIPSPSSSGRGDRVSSWEDLVDKASSEEREEMLEELLEAMEETGQMSADGAAALRESAGMDMKEEWPWNA
jgi:PRTRC genetic system protein A